MMTARMRVAMREGRTILLDDFLSLFDSPWVSIFFGCFFLLLGWFRGRRRPPGSLSAGTGRIMFGVVGLLMLLGGLIQMWKTR